MANSLLSKLLTTQKSSSSLLITALIYVIYFFIGVICISLPILDYKRLVWEGYTKDFLQSKPESFRDHLRESVLWHDGLVSTPNRSLIYGLPLYFVDSLLEARVLSLSLTVTLTYLTLLLTQDKVLKIGIFLYLTHPITVFYSWYAVSVGAGISLAMFVTIASILTLKKSSSFLCLLLGVAVSIASYEYTPIRFYCLTLMSFLTVHLMIVGRIKNVLCIMCVPVVIFTWNFIHGRLEQFYSSRGEQIVNILQQPDYIKMFFGEDNLPSSLDMIIFLVKKNLPGLVKQFTFTVGVVTHDPPLIPLTFGLFGLLAFFGAIKLWFENRPLLLLFLVSIGTISCLLLLTTRVDTHRISVLTPSICMLTANGVAFFMERLKSRTVYHLVLTVLIACSYTVSLVALANG